MDASPHTAHKAAVAAAAVHTALHSRDDGTAAAEEARRACNTAYQAGQHLQGYNTARHTRTATRHRQQQLDSSIPEAERQAHRQLRYQQGGCERLHYCLELQAGL